MYRELWDSTEGALCSQPDQTVLDDMCVALAMHHKHTGIVCMLVPQHTLRW